MSWNAYFQTSLDTAEAEGLLRRRNAHVDNQATEIRASHSRVLINFGTNDYLGLRHESKLLDAAARSLAASGVGAGASPLVSGYNLALAELEQSLARWQDVPAALVFSSGFGMNVGVISALAGPNDLVLSDRLNHASLIDGCRLSGAHKRVYAHNDADAVRQLLKLERTKYQRALVITESIFSMDGDAAPLMELTEICQHYDAGLVVDEAHATGIYGATGAGLGQQLGLSNQWLVKLGTLSKSLGTCGGYVAGSQLLIDFLVNRCRSYIFSTAIAPPVVAATQAAVDWMPQLSQRRERLRTVVTRVRAELLSLGWQIPAGDSPIIPVVVGKAEQVTDLSHRLLASGCYVPAIRPPTVPVGAARLRISLSAAHTDQQIDRLLSGMKMEARR